MAVGDKIYIADKETLDTVNTNTADTKSKVGTTSDTGGSATAGTLFAKLNALISHLLTNWTTARAARMDNLDAAVSTRESEASALTRYNTLYANTAVNNTASATGTLSQKMTHVIGQVENVNANAVNGGKRLSSKVIDFTVAAAGTHTIINITGSGVFEFAVTTMGYTNSALTFEIDGQTQVINSGAGLKYIFNSIYGAGALLYPVDSTSISSATHFAASKPLYFRQSLKITVNTTVATELYFRGSYALYE